MPPQEDLWSDFDPAASAPFLELVLPETRPPLPPRRKSPTPPVRPFVPLTPPPDKVSLLDAEDRALEPISPSLWRSRWSIKYRSHGRTTRTPSTTSGSPEDYFSPETSIGEKLELSDTPLPSPTADHNVPRANKIALKSKRMWTFRKPKDQLEDSSMQSTHRIPALEGESIASRHKFDTAYIEGSFSRIEYGQFKGRPACLVVIDLMLVYQPKNTIKGMEIRFQFGKDDTLTSSYEDLDQKTVEPTISQILFPRDLQSVATYSRVTKHSNIKPAFSALSVHASAGGGGKHSATPKNHRWHVQGRTDDHDGIYDTFGWDIFENEISSDSVPRHVRLGMIAFHEHKRFWVDTTVEGSIRGPHFFSKVTREKRWFYPPSSGDVGEHPLDEQILENIVIKTNKTIQDVALGKSGERPRRDRVEIRNVNGRARRDRNGGTNPGSVDDTSSLAGGPGDVSSLAEDADDAPDMDTMDDGIDAFS